MKISYLKNPILLCFGLVVCIGIQANAQRKVARASMEEMRKYESIDDCYEWYLTSLEGNHYLFSVENYGAKGLFSFTDHNFFLRIEGPKKGEDLPLWPELIDDGIYIDHFLNGKLLTVFYSSKIKGQQVYRLFAFQVNLEDMDISKPVAIPTSRYRDPRFWNGQLMIEQSENGKFIILSRIPSDDPELGKNFYEFICLDQELDLLWEQQQVLAEDDVSFEVRKSFISDDGDVLIIAFKKFGGFSIFKRDRTRPEFEFDLISFTDEGENFQMESLYKETDFITSLSGYLKDGVVHLVGFYADMDRNSNRPIKGLYQLDVDPKDFEISNERYIDVRKQMLNQNESWESNGRIDTDLRHLVIDYFYPMPDGSLLIPAENYFISYKSDSNGNPYIAAYHARNLLVFKIDPNGEFEWVSKVSKEQRSKSHEEFISYYGFTGDNKLYLVYNDHIKNLKITNERKGVKKFKGGLNSILCLTIIDENGNIKKQPLLDNKDEKVLPMPEKFGIIDEDEVFIYGKRSPIGKSYKIGKIEL